MDLNIDTSSGVFSLFFTLLFVHILLNFPLKVSFLTPTPARPNGTGTMFDQVSGLLLFYHIFMQCFAVYVITKNIKAVLISAVIYLTTDLGRAWNRITMLSEELIHLIVKILLVVLLLLH